MGRQRIEEIKTSFEQIFKFIMSKPDRTLSGLVTTGNVPFSCQAKKTRDNRAVITLPHNNRIYENDWGYYFNGMGKDGQRIGQYSIPINRKYLETKAT
jgi:hypothetical protein